MKRLHTYTLNFSQLEVHGPTRYRINRVGRGDVLGTIVLGLLAEADMEYEDGSVVRNAGNRFRKAEAVFNLFQSLV